MNKFLAWWKKDQRYILLGKAVLMALLPWLCCLAYCMARQQAIGKVYLPASEWNDELFYFKQVEGIVHHGFPQGFFGFNESHALKLSFAAWSPVLVFPWIIWGALFGWNFMTPVICNLFLLTFTMVLFVCLVKPTWKQLGILTILFCLYTPFVRYILSGMPEIICFSMLIILYALAIRYIRGQKGALLVWMFVLSGLMTLMRPYLILFLLLPAFLWIRKSKWKGIIGSGIVIGIVGVIYVLIKHYLGAEYFAPLFFTDWVEAFFEQGIVSGFMYTLRKFHNMGSAFLGHMRMGVKDGLASGAFFCCYMAMLAVLGIHTLQCLWENRKQKREELTAEIIVTFHLAFSFVGMLVALLLMYKLTEGSKHLLTFMAAGVFIISIMRTRMFKKMVFMGCVFSFFLIVKAVDPYDYEVPYQSQELVVQITDWQNALGNELQLTGNQVPNFDNVVIWQLNDKVDEKWISTKWQLLYALPEGFGISCCEQGYIVEHLDTLQSKYIALPTGGEVDAMCLEKGYEKVHADQDMTLYRRY